MKQTFATIAPTEICEPYDAALQEGASKSEILAMLFSKFGELLPNTAARQYDWYCPLGEWFHCKLLILLWR
jgi:hypothetical protein